MYAFCLFLLLLPMAQQQRSHDPLAKKNNTQKPNAGSQHKQTDSSENGVSGNYQIHEPQKKTQQEQDADAFDRGFQHFYWGATILGVLISLGLFGALIHQNKLTRKAANAAQQSADAARDNVGSLEKQLTEMQKARVQTDELIKAASDQVAEMKSAGAQTGKLIEHAERQVDALLTAAEIATTHAKATAEIAKSTVMSTEAHIKSADAAKASADAALLNAQAMVNAQRAWLFIEIKTTIDRDTTPGAIPKNMGFTVTFRNWGKTPAEVVGFDQHPDCRENLNDLPVPPQYSLEGHVMTHTRMVPPGETWSHPGESYFSPSGFLLDDWEKVRKSQKRFIYWGRIQYRDLIEEAKTIHELKRDKPITIHETCFCYFWSPPLNEFLITGPLGYNKHT